MYLVLSFVGLTQLSLDKITEEFSEWSEYYMNLLIVIIHRLMF